MLGHDPPTYLRSITANTLCLMWPSNALSRCESKHLGSATLSPSQTFTY